jgi:hypothetical protein
MMETAISAVGIRSGTVNGITGVKRRFTCFLAAASAVTLLACSPSNPSGDTQQGNQAAALSSAVTNPANQALDAAASPAENLIEAVLAKDSSAGDTAYAELQQAMSKLNSAQLGKNAAAINELFQSLNAGWQTSDRPAAAMAAVGLYARLQQAKDWTGAEVPLEVSMLDHAGFKSELLSAQSPIDWAALGATAGDAQRDLATIDKTLKDDNLKLVANGIVGHLVAGAKTKDIERVKGAARDLLAVVDLLEQQYHRQAGNAGGQ